MDNISRISIVSPYDTAIDESIYFSFNSTVADKTLEVDNNLRIEMYEGEDKENIKTVIKKTTGLTPLRAVPKSILQEFKAFSSTPTRKLCIEENVEAMALGVAPLKENFTEKSEFDEACTQEGLLNDMQASNRDKDSPGSDSKENVFFFRNITKNNEENSVKERDLNINGIDHSSITSIVIVDTSISFSEKETNDKEKGNSVTNESAEEIVKYNEETNTLLKDELGKSVENSFRRMSLEHGHNVPIIIISDCSSESESEENDVDVTNVARKSASKNLDEDNGNAKESISLNKKEGERKIPVANKRLSSIATRRSVLPNEPDLSRNKPSRIVEKGFLAKTSKLTPSKFVTQIPRLLNNIMEIQSGSGTDANSTSGNQKAETVKKPNINRKSMLPPPPLRNFQEKRRTVFTQPLNKRLSTIRQNMATVNEKSPKKPRKSGVLKTTLNSPANMRRSVRKTMGPSTSVMMVSKKSENLLPTVGMNRIPLRRSKAPTQVESKTVTEYNSKCQGKSIAPKSNQNFSCEKCQRTFRLSSSLEAHKKTHVAASGSPPMCKYCDKKFAISKALENHLLEKCPKIPTSERKKLLAASITIDEKPTKSGISYVKKSPKQKSIASVSTCSIDSTTSIHKADSSHTDTESMPPPPPSSKTKKKVQMPHSGVYRTPSKPVVCHPCKKNFDNILNFTEHVLSHSSSGPDS